MTCDLWVADFHLWSFDQMEVAGGEEANGRFICCPGDAGRSPQNKDMEGASIVVRFLENILPRFIIKI